MSRPERIGIVGTGVAGLGCAYYLASTPELRDRVELTLLERNDYAGGHTNTREVEENGRSLPIDTGFIVFNHVTYPLLTALFADLGVATKPAEMSFAVRHDPDHLEYNGMSVNKVFAQRRNLLRPGFYRLLRDILRFFKAGRASLNDAKVAELTLEDFCRHHGLGREFIEWYLVPMSSSVWSTEPADVLAFPARSLLRFFDNHGFLGVTTHHPWFTVEGGARTYVAKILARVGAPRLRADVRSLQETSDGVKLRTATGEVLRFDRVILAGHADESLALLSTPDALQQKLLGSFRYQKNHAVLHTDPGLLPRRRRAWAAWNFLVEPAAEKTAPPRATVHYWMNALQGVSPHRDYFVSLNSSDRIAESAVLYETTYEHPVFTLAAMQAQERLAELNHRSPGQRVFFCGSYFRYGFHEDALWSASELIKKSLRPLLSGTPPARG